MDNLWHMNGDEWMSFLVAAFLAVKVFAEWLHERRRKKEKLSERMDSVEQRVTAKADTERVTAIADRMTAAEDALTEKADCDGVTTRFDEQTKALDELKRRQDVDHKTHRSDTEKLNVMIGEVSNELARRGAQVDAVEKHVDNLEHRMNKRGA